MFQLKNHKSIYYFDELKPVSKDKPNTPITVWGFDMDSTLITTKSGKTFATDENDWIPWNDKVTEMFRSKETDDVWIVIFTNQLAVSKGKVTIDTLSKKFKAVIDYYGIGAKTAIYILTEKDKYRKPHTHAWSFFIDNHKDCTIDMKLSFYCGDAAGRRTDFSSSDRYFAHNIGLKFLTPEQFFLGKEMDKISDPYDSPEFNVKNVNQNLLKQIIGDGKRLIVLTGMPGSGKSTLSSTLEKNGFVVICKDVMKTKAVKEFEKAIIANKNIVVDCTNPDVESRKKWLSGLNLGGYKKVSVHVSTPLIVCRHQNALRVELGVTDQPVPDIVYNIYKKKFVTPDKTEGFDEVYEYPYVYSGGCKEYMYRYELD